MGKVLKIRDLTLRDGQQSLFATRLRQENIDRLLPLYRKAGFYIMEVWGGDVLEVTMSCLDESPWDRLRRCAKEMEGVSLLSALSRGRNLFGHVPYPEYVLDGFYKEAFRNGLNVMRIFDANNNIEDIRDSVALINEYGGIADVALCYMEDPKAEPKPEPKKKGFFARLFGDDSDSDEPKPIFTDEYFVNKAKEMEALGAKIFTLKDMNGVVAPSRIYTLMPKLKHAVRIPVDFHTHSTFGYGLASALMAIIKGVDIVDTNIWWFAGGAAAPPIELIWLFCRKLELEIAVDMEAVAEIRKELKTARIALADYDSNADHLPHDFDEYLEKMPEEIDAQFRRAIDAASDNDEPQLLDACRRIEDYFGFPRPRKRSSKELTNLANPYHIEEVSGGDADPSNEKIFREPANPELPEFGGVKLARNDEEFLLLELLPDVAERFLKKKRQEEFAYVEKNC